MGVINVQKKLFRVKSTTIPKMSKTILVEPNYFLRSLSFDVWHFAFGIFQDFKLMILFVKSNVRLKLNGIISIFYIKSRSV